MASSARRAPRPTLEQVGEVAGVSRATVSRVINNSPKVSPEVRAAVETVNRATAEFAARRMDRGMKRALAGRTVDSIA